MGGAGGAIDAGTATGAGGSTAAGGSGSGGSGSGGSGTGGSGTGGSGMGGSGTGGSGTGGSGTGGKIDSGTETPVAHNINYTFDSDLQMWTLSNYADPNGDNLSGAYVTGVGGAGAPGAPTLAWDGTVGQPDVGSLKVSVIFTACNQYVDPIIFFAFPKNETGRMLRARLQVTSGMFSGGAQLHVNTGSDFAYQAGQFTIEPDGTFGIATLDLTNPIGTVNPAQVVGVGVEIYTGYVCPYPNAGVPVIFNIDTVTD